MTIRHLQYLNVKFHPKCILKKDPSWLWQLHVVYSNWLPSLGPRANERPEVWRCTEPGPTEPKRAINHRNRQVPRNPNVFEMIKVDQYISTFCLSPFFFRSSHSLSWISCKGKGPQAKMHHWGGKEGLKWTGWRTFAKIQRSLKVESCKIEMPHLMPMHNWMWNIGHCRCWGSLKGLLHHLPFLGIWQIVPFSSIRSSFHPFLPTYQPLAPKHAKGPWQEGLPPSVDSQCWQNLAHWWKQPELLSEASDIPMFEISAKTLMNATKDLNLRDSAVRRLSKMTWKKSTKTENNRSQKTIYKKSQETYENRIWGSGKLQPSQPKKATDLRQVAGGCPRSKSPRTRTCSLFLQIVLPNFPTNFPGF